MTERRTYRQWIDPAAETALDAAGVWAEAAAVLVLMTLVPWLWDRTRKTPDRPVAAAPVSVRPRDLHPYEDAGVVNFGSDDQEETP